MTGVLAAAFAVLSVGSFIQAFGAIEERTRGINLASAGSLAVVGLICAVVSLALAKLT